MSRSSQEYKELVKLMFRHFEQWGLTQEQIGLGATGWPKKRRNSARALAARWKAWAHNALWHPKGPGTHLEELKQFHNQLYRDRHYVSDKPWAERCEPLLLLCVNLVDTSRTIHRTVARKRISIYDLMDECGFQTYGLASVFCLWNSEREAEWKTWLTKFYDECKIKTGTGNWMPLEERLEAKGAFSLNQYRGLAQLLGIKLSNLLSIVSTHAKLILDEFRDVQALHKEAARELTEWQREIEVAKELKARLLKRPNEAEMSRYLKHSARWEHVANLASKGVATSLVEVPEKYYKMRKNWLEELIQMLTSISPSFFTNCKDSVEDLDSQIDALFSTKGLDYDDRKSLGI